MQIPKDQHQRLTGHGLHMKQQWCFRQAQPHMLAAQGPLVTLWEFTGAEMVRGGG